jgi:2-C-methyl-D-erythritol 4-phosphate cytidylyltransferase
MLFLVVPGGGMGLRMGADVPKQFLDWGGTPLICATVNAFFAADMPKIDGIALALPPDRLDEAAKWAFPAPHWCTSGGATRQESVAAAIRLLPDAPQAVVMIHDAVRPFPPSQPIHEAIGALDAWDGSVLAEASMDTLKRIDDNFKIIATESREQIFRAQTPQMAKLSTWRNAFAWAVENDFTGTDDVSILEAMRLNVRLIPSPSSNRKLTVPEDLHIFQRNQFRVGQESPLTGLKS